MATWATAARAQPAPAARPRTKPRPARRRRTTSRPRVAGVNDRLEIWDRAAWRKELAAVEGSAEDVAERVATKRD